MYIPAIDLHLPILLQEIRRPILGEYNRSQTHECGNWDEQFPEKVYINEILVAVQAVSGSIQTRYQKDVPFFRWIGEKYTQTQPTPLVLRMMTVY
jgi:hypothetical protein